MSFYQTYRPRKISELDLSSVREALQSSLSSGKISHAYLFVGPRGSGKTSTARILAQVVNCEKNRGKKENLSEPCGECQSCQVISKGNSVDVIEIDAASNGLVDDIRDLRDKVRLAPVQLTRKIYIIDEVHMVSTAGFNALLKTLEEPPAHVLFVLCTTELQKVPDTIVSRCAKVNFTKATGEELIRSLMKAVSGEGLTVSDEILSEIAEATDGSFREGHKILEQLSAFGKKINEDTLAKVIGSAGKTTVNKLLKAAVDGDNNTVTKIFEEMEGAGVKAPLLATSLLQLAKKEMEDKIRKGENPGKEISIIDSLIGAADRIKISPLPLLPIEIALLSVMISGEREPRPKGFSPAQETPKDEVIKPSLNSLIKQEEEVKEDIKNTHPITVSGISIEKVKTDWTDFLNDMSQNYGSLAGLLRMVSPVDLQGKNLTLSVTSRFQQDMLERDAKKKIIEEQMAKVWGPLTFKCVLVEKSPRTEVATEDDNLEKPVDEMLGTVNVMSAAEKIFGA